MSRRAVGAARLCREVGLGAGAYGAYLLSRRAVWTDIGRKQAHINAERIYAAEQRVHVAIEPAVQRAVVRWNRLTDAFNAAYGLANIGLTLGWLVHLYRRRDPAYGRERAAALLAFLGALPAFTYAPTAPPRTLDGFVDTLDARGIDIDRPALQRFYNPIAAMPSLHLAFAVATGFGLAGRARFRWTRRLWKAYPAGVAVVVVATGNHFLADVGAGALLGAASRTVTRAVPG